MRLNSDNSGSCSQSICLIQGVQLGNFGPTINFSTIGFMVVTYERASSRRVLRHQRARIRTRPCRLKWHHISCVQTTTSAFANSFFYSHTSPSCLAVSVWRNRRTKRSLRYRTLRNRTSPRRRASLLAGRSFTNGTGRGRLLPRRPQRGVAFRRRWIRRRSQMPIGRMVVRRLLGSRTRIAIH